MESFTLAPLTLTLLEAAGLQGYQDIRLNSMTVKSDVYLAFGVEKTPTICAKTTSKYVPKTLYQVM